MISVPAWIGSSPLRMVMRRATVARFASASVKWALLAGGCAVCPGQAAPEGHPRQHEQPAQRTANSWAEDRFVIPPTRPDLDDAAVDDPVSSTSSAGPRLLPVPCGQSAESGDDAVRPGLEPLYIDLQVLDALGSDEPHPVDPRVGPARRELVHVTNDVGGK